MSGGDDLYSIGLEPEGGRHDTPDVYNVPRSTMPNGSIGGSDIGANEADDQRVRDLINQRFEELNIVTTINTLVNNSIAVANAGTKVNRLTTDSAFSVPNSTTTAISWLRIEDNGDDTMWSSLDPTKVTARHAGIYIVGGHVHWASSTVGTRAVDVRTSGTNFRVTVSYAPSSATPDPNQIVVTTVQLNIGDYAELTVFQNRGSPLTIPNCHMFMYLIRPL